MAATSSLAALAKDATLTGGGARAAGLVKVPIGVTPWTPYQIGSATVAVSTGNNENTDGTQGKCVFSVPAGPPNHGVLRTQLRGRVIGVRVARDQGTNSPPFFDVVIDGVVYPVDNVATRRNNEVITPQATDREAQLIVAQALSDTVHTVEIHLPCDVTGGSARRLEVFGYLAEANRGYQALRGSRTGTLYVQGGTTLTTTPEAIPFILAASGLAFRCSSATVDRTVALYDNSGTNIWHEIVLNSVANVKTREADGSKTTGAVLWFPTPMGMSGMKWKTSEGADVKGWVINA